MPNAWENSIYFIGHFRVSVGNFFACQGRETPPNSENESQVVNGSHKNKLALMGEFPATLPENAWPFGSKLPVREGKRGATGKNRREVLCCACAAGAAP